MGSFFSLYTFTPWDGLNSKQLTQVKLLSLKTAFHSFPVIEQTFFEDLMLNVYNQSHYTWKKTIKRIVGVGNEDYDITSFNFIWAFDDQNRMYQLLFQKIEEKEKSQAILVALAPPGLGKLLSKFKREALHRILTLLNKSSHLKFLMVLAPKGKSIVEEKQLLRVDKNEIDKLSYINELKNIPNMQGQWFPEFKSKCPVCKGEISGVGVSTIDFGRLICPRCGYKGN